MDDSTDLAPETMLDGNAAAGVLRDIFGVEMTAHLGRCASCGNVAALGTLHAWIAGPGIVLRCSVCHEVVLRVVEVPDTRYIDARGAAYLRLLR
jgi:hypothetical protein